MHQMTLIVCDGHGGDGTARASAKRYQGVINRMGWMSDSC